HRTIRHACGGSPWRNLGTNPRTNVSRERARVFFPKTLWLAPAWSLDISPCHDRASSRISSSSAPPFWIRVWYFGEGGVVSFVSIVTQILRADFVVPNLRAASISRHGLATRRSVSYSLKMEYVQAA